MCCRHPAQLGRTAACDPKATCESGGLAVSKFKNYETANKALCRRSFLLFSTPLALRVAVPEMTRSRMAAMFQTADAVGELWGGRLARLRTPHGSLTKRRIAARVPPRLRGPFARRTSTPLRRRSPWHLHPPSRREELGRLADGRFAQQPSAL